MTTSNKKTEPILAIFHYDQGIYTAGPASIEAARQLLESRLRDFPEEHYPGLRLARKRKADKDAPDKAEKTEYAVPDRPILALFKELKEKPEDTESVLLCKMANEIRVEGEKQRITQEIRKEFAYWALETNYHPDTADYHFLRKYQPEKFLSFLAGLKARAKGRSVQYYATQDLEDADELYQLLYGKWKPNAHVENVVTRYLVTLNAYCRRDDRYEVGLYHPEGLA